MSKTPLTPNRAAWMFAAAFSIAGFMGFVPNPLVGDGALFQTNLAHNLVHVGTALGFALVARAGEAASLLFLRAFGAIYLLVGLLGWIALGGAPEGMLLGVVHINALDNFLHVGLAGAILAASVVTAPAGRRRAVA